MSGEWAASVKSNIGFCAEEAGEHSSPIFINKALYKTGVAIATRIRPLLFYPLHATSRTKNTNTNWRRKAFRIKKKNKTRRRGKNNPDSSTYLCWLIRLIRVRNSGGSQKCLQISCGSNKCPYMPLISNIRVVLRSWVLQQSFNLVFRGSPTELFP